VAAENLEPAVAIAFGKERKTVEEGRFYERKRDMGVIDREGNDSYNEEQWNRRSKGARRKLTPRQEGLRGAEVSRTSAVGVWTFRA